MNNFREFLKSLNNPTARRRLGISATMLFMIMAICVMVLQYKKQVAIQKENTVSIFVKPLGAYGHGRHAQISYLYKGKIFVSPIKTSIMPLIHAAINGGGNETIKLTGYWTENVDKTIFLISSVEVSGY
jgi:hypothetical protein